MKSTKSEFVARCVLAALVFIHGHLFASGVKLPTDTRVYVETKEALIGKGDQVQQGQIVRSQVWRDVVIDGQVLIAAGTPVLAKVDQIKHRQIAGVKGSMTIGAYEVEAIDGQTIQLSGGYNKEGKSRMALSITLGVLFILPIFIPGKAAELPSGTVFDAYVDNSWQVDVGEHPTAGTIDLTFMGSDIEAELLYDKLEAQEKPKYFDFQITTPADAPREFVIDRINSEEVKPLKLETVSEITEGEEAIVVVQIKIKDLIKNFAKGINTIEIANIAGEERVSTKLIVNIQI